MATASAHREQKEAPLGGSADRRTGASLPDSCTALWVNTVGFGCCVGALVATSAAAIEPLHGALLTVCAYAAPIILLEIFFLRTHRRASTGLEPGRTLREIDWRRVAARALGLYVTVGVVALGYWALPEYRGSFYAPYYTALRYLVPILIAGAIPYFCYLDRKLVDPRDSYWRVGMLVTGRRELFDAAILQQHFLGWLVKAFFLPLMLVYLSRNIAFIQTHGLIDSLQTFRTAYDYLYNFIFTFDLVAVCAGYALTLRALDSHIRSTEPTFFGWAVTLVCYQPFWSLAERLYFAYDDGNPWGHWLESSSLLYAVWGSTILVLLSIYAYATLSFGIRFSNLTHRGVLTNGPYRFSKHPAYVSKNLAWWLISMPFLSHASAFEALRHCLLLLALNGIYFLRAKTEERHLSQDPVYVQYVRYIHENGLLRCLGERLPFLGGRLTTRL